MNLPTPPDKVRRRSRISVAVAGLALCLGGCFGDFKITSMPAWSDTERIRQSSAASYRHLVLDLREGASNEFAFSPSQARILEAPTSLPAVLTVHIYVAAGPDQSPPPVLVITTGESQLEYLPVEFALAARHQFFIPVPMQHHTTLQDWRDQSIAFVHQYRYFVPLATPVPVEVGVRLLNDTDAEVQLPVGTGDIYKRDRNPRFDPPP